MKILITGDWHIDDKPPKRRTDEWFDTMTKKMGFIIKHYKAHKCEALLQPGDMFNSYRANYRTVNFLITMLQDINVFCVPGQHDLRYHNRNMDNTPMSVLMRAHSTTFHLLSPNPTLHHKGLYLYGAGWGDNLPDIKAKNSILVTHRMVIDQKKLWPGQEEFTWADDLNILPCELIVTGDNHQSFQNGKVVNCGSLLRTSIIQKDHKPCFYIYNTETKELEKFFVPIEPMEDVMDLQTAMEEKERNEKLEAFVKGLKEDNTKNPDLNFLQNLERYCDENGIKKPVLDIIEEVLRG